MTEYRLKVQGNRLLLQQGEALLERLTDAEYAEVCLAGWAPVGAQYRHILEHYHAFFRGLATGRVDYDARPRELRLERSREAAREATREYLAALEALDGADERAILVQTDTGAPSPDGAADWRPSSAGRELQFLCSHTVHHYALIALLLKDVGPDLGPEFGVAPPTLADQRAAR